jgi:regulation of enolase protein 1 (concanavalin A-like superfamily)
VTLTDADLDARHAPLILEIMPFNLPKFPFDLDWHNPPEHWAIDSQNGLTITAGPQTDLFTDPANAKATDNAPAALFTPPDAQFILIAKVKVGFTSTYDAGTLQLRQRNDLWAKLCFEYSPQGKPMIVSVVTRGVSDDCNSTVIDGDEVYLRLLCTGQTIAFHYSLDGQFWNLVRYFTLDILSNPQVGFSAQSPTGQQCTVTFSGITYRAGTLSDIRSGE